MLLLLKTFLMIFIAEMGDKTQFLLIAMSSRYRVREILIGVGAAILVLNGLAIALGSLIGKLLPTLAINFIAGAAFLYFAFAALKGEEEEENAEGKRGAGTFASIVAIFGTFFLAELGDKTQLAALTVAAESGFAGFLPVFIGASVGLFAADMIGLVAGLFLNKNLPSWIFSWLSFGIFAVCGLIKILSGFEEVFAAALHPTLFPILCTSAVAIVFAGIVLIFRLTRSHTPSED